MQLLSRLYWWGWIKSSVINGAQTAGYSANGTMNDGTFNVNNIDCALSTPRVYAWKGVGSINTMPANTPLKVIIDSARWAYYYRSSSKAVSSTMLIYGALTSGLNSISFPEASYIFLGTQTWGDSSETSTGQIKAIFT